MRGRAWIAVVCLGLALACGPGKPRSEGIDVSDVAVAPPDEWLTTTYRPVHDQACGLDTAAFMALHPEPQYVEALSYEPATATYLPQIREHLTLTAEQEAVLGRQGFVAAGHTRGNAFGTSYLDLYEAHLPVLITADSLLHALHRSFDDILIELEGQVLIPALERMLQAMHAQLAKELAGLPEGLRAAGTDVDVYLAVARSLLTATPTAPVSGDAEAQASVTRILAAVTELQPVELALFGVTATHDMSQMTPRGHYAEYPPLQQYFQAMMWLGRAELPMVTFDEQRKPTFHRRGLNAAALSNHLLAASGADADWARVDDALTSLIGEHDSMTPTDLREFMAESGIRTLAELARADDRTLYQGLMREAYGLQRIASQVIVSDPTAPNVALPRVYMLMGQRFTIDSHIFNNVTYDRVQDLRTGTKTPRMLPSELDVQFALGNDAAARHLRPELERYGYQGVLHELRFLIDAHPPEFWGGNFYNGWLGTIRALNDRTDFERRPEAMRTAAWADKTLHTQAASWAELRHDTLLYAKQSYSMMAACEYPDAYVEPVPAFYARLGELGRLGTGLMQRLEVKADMSRAIPYFEHLTTVADTLAGIARKELAGEARTKEETEFLKATIEKEMIGCGTVHYDGWYGGLFYDSGKVDDGSPTIADVHTAPSDEAGNEKGWVLHAATGAPMLMVFTVKDCAGVKAYVGPISSYHSVLTEGYQRLTDQAWAETVAGGTPPRPAWTSSFVR